MDDCDNLEEDGYYYPQFNGARNVSPLVRSYIPDLERYCEETGYVLTDEQQALLDKAKEMINCTENNFEEDNALIDDVHDMLVEIGVYAPEEEPDKAEVLLNKVLKKANDITYKLFGAKGFLDFGK